MIPITSDKIIEVIRDEICNPDLNVNFIGYKLECSSRTILRRVKEDFNTTPNDLIECVRLFKIFKYSYDHQHSIYKSATYYGIKKGDSFRRITKRRYGKTPCDIEFEIAIEKNRKENFYKYHKDLLVENLLL